MLLKDSAIRRFGVMYEGLKTTSVSALNYKSVFLVRRMAIAFQLTYGIHFIGQIFAI
jgi:hypothetical protein